MLHVEGLNTYYGDSHILRGVSIELPAGTALPDETVRGITYVVSNSVEGLSSDDVAVMDDGGHVLSAPADAGTAGGLTSRQLDLQRTVERQLSDKIESMLATVVGQGRARAQVSALLGFDQVDRTEETYDPETQVLQLEQRSEGGEPPNPGTVVSNTYQNSRMVERRSAAVGEVERLTVAVLVDDEAMRSAPPPLRGADGIARLEAMVRDAAGLDTTRGDRLTVMAVPFEKVMPAEAGTRAENAAKGPSPIVIVERWSRPAAGLLALVVLALLAFRVVAGGAPARAPDGMPAGAALGAGGPLAGGAPDGGRNGANGNRTDEAARVMRAWLEDRR